MNVNTLQQRRNEVQFVATQEEVDYKLGGHLLFLAEHGCDYKTSPQWAALRERAKAEFPFECFVCGDGTALALHHKTYMRYTFESLEDVCWLCINCHFPSHKWGRFTGKQNTIIDDTDWISPDQFLRLIRLSEQLGYSRVGWVSLLRVFLDFTDAHPSLFRKR